MRNLSCVLVVACLAGPAHAVDVLSCPQHLAEAGKFHMLDMMKLYDGAVQAEAEILPKTTGIISTWDIAASRAAGAVPVVFCTFKHTKDTRQYTLPQIIGSCSFTNKYPAISECR